MYPFKNNFGAPIISKQPFSSPEPKAEDSFHDNNLSIVCRWRRRCRHWRCHRKLLYFHILLQNHSQF